MELYFGNNTYNINDSIIYEQYVLNEDEQNTQINKQPGNTYETALKTVFSNNEMAQKVKNLLGNASNKDNTPDEQTSINYDAILKNIENGCNTLYEFPEFT